MLTDKRVSQLIYFLIIDCACLLERSVCSTLYYYIKGKTASSTEIFGAISLAEGHRVDL